MWKLVVEASQNSPAVVVHAMLLLPSRLLVKVIDNVSPGAILNVGPPIPFWNPLVFTPGYKLGRKSTSSMVMAWVPPEACRTVWNVSVLLAVVGGVGAGERF